MMLYSLKLGGFFVKPVFSGIGRECDQHFNQTKAFTVLTTGPIQLGYSDNLGT